MEQVNCSNCMVCAFKDSLCTSEICDRFRKRGDCEDFEGLLLNSVKRGRWLFKTNAFTMKDGSQFAGYKCSECGNAVWHGGNYCPNCGAKMEEQE